MGSMSLSLNLACPCKEIYTERAQLLLPLFPDPKDDDKKGPLTSQFVSTINSHSNPASIWIRLMSEDPSVLKSMHCSNKKCGEKQRKLSTFCPDNPSLRRFGFKRLQDTLKYYPKLWNVKCPCRAVRCEENVSNCHVYLKLDCRERATDPGSKLYDLPTSLNLSREYRLAGVVSYDATYDHFVAYCCRRTGTWAYHDGLLSKVKPVKGNPVIQPECALYLINQ